MSEPKPMMRLLYSIVTLALFLPACTQPGQDTNTDEVNSILDHWHRAAAEADGDYFFGLIAEDGIYIGTDAHERWGRAEFIEFAKPYFDRGSAWDFKPHDRDLHISRDGKYVWFSELLTTWMGECRGSGILEKSGTTWKLKQYHLSVTVPNDIIRDFIQLVDDYHKGDPK